MIWLTWRQFRTQAIIAVATLAALAVALAFTGPGLAQLARDTGVATCGSDCASVAGAFLSRAGRHTIGALYYLGIAVMFVLPGLVGMFWGAPLVARELESGTHKLVWNQSIPRGRWLAVKLAATGGATVVLTGLLSLAITWWAAPIDRAYTNRIAPQIFAARGVVPLGYAALALVTGVLLGILIRRVVPAMAVTLLLVVGMQVATPALLRPLLSEPVRSSFALESDESRGFVVITPPAAAGRILAGAWILSERTITADGRTFTGSADPASCGRDTDPGACERWMDTLGLQREVIYLPGDRFWRLQWRELGVLLATTTLLGGLGLWWIRRGLT